MHDVQISMDQDHHNVVTRVYTEEVVNAFRAQIDEVDRLADELHDLLTSYESMIEREGMDDQIETLVRWAESYSSGLSTAGKISRDGHALLRGMDQRLHHESGKEFLSEELSSPADAVSSVQPKHFGGAARQLGQVPLAHASVVPHLGRMPVRSAARREGGR